MKIVVFGATGFIGKNVCELLTSNAQFEVLAPTRADVNLQDADATEGYLREARPEIVLYSAVDLLSAENTIRSFVNVHNNRRYFGKLIHLGSGAEYDRRNYVPLQSEDHFGKSIPVETYGLAKYMIAREIESRNDKKSLNLRLFGVFGPYEDYRRRFLSNNICRVISGHSVMVNRDMKFDYLDVSDLGRFLSGLIQAGCNLSGSYNFCTGKPMRLTDIGAMIAEKMLGTRSVEVVDAGENAEYSGSPARIFSEYGSFTFTPIEDSLSNLIEYYKKELVADKLEEFKRFLIGK